MVMDLFLSIRIFFLFVCLFVCLFRDNTAVAELILCMVVICQLIKDIFDLFYRGKILCGGCSAVIYDNTRLLKCYNGLRM